MGCAELIAERSFFERRQKLDVESKRIKLEQDIAEVEAVENLIIKTELINQNQTQNVLMSTQSPIKQKN